MNAFRTVIFAAFAIMTIGFFAMGTAHADVNTKSVSRDTVMKVGKLIKLHDGVVPTPRQLAAVAEDPALALMALFDNDEIQDHIREWGLSALTQYNDDKRVHEYFAAKLSKKRLSDHAFEQVLMAAARTLGEDATDLVEPLLASRKPTRRLLAVKALGMFCGQQGYDLLKSLSTETANDDVISAAANWAH